MPIIPQFTWLNNKRPLSMITVKNDEATNEQFNCAQPSGIIEVFSVLFAIERMQQNEQTSEQNCIMRREKSCRTNSLMLAWATIRAISCRQHWSEWAKSVWPLLCSLEHFIHAKVKIYGAATHFITISQRKHKHILHIRHVTKMQRWSHECSHCNAATRNSNWLLQLLQPDHLLLLKYKCLTIT